MLLLNQEPAVATTVADSIKKIIILCIFYVESVQSPKHINAKISQLCMLRVCGPCPQDQGISQRVSLAVSRLVDLLGSRSGFCCHTVCPDFLSVDSRETRCARRYCVNMQPNSKAGTGLPPTSNLCFPSCLTTVTFYLWRSPIKAPLTCSATPSFFGC